MARVEPVPDTRAAVVECDGERVLTIADYHAGVEAALRAERGLNVVGRAGDRRERVRSLLAETEPDRLLVVGDFMHSIGGPGGAEQGEIEVLLESLPSWLPVTLVKGNHDGDIESWLEGVDVTPSGGVRFGDVGFVHGHTWPDPVVLGAETVCVGHEHPCVRLEDEIGGSRVERTWLRGRLDPAPFLDRPEYEGVSWLADSAVEPPRVVVMPAFNDLVGGTWVNIPNQSFLSPFLPAGLADGEAYLLDGTRLGAYQSV